MRDNHQGLPEILETHERDGRFFGVVQITLGAEPYAFEIGISEDGHRCLRKILQLRPYEATPVGRYRYFFVPTVGGHNPNSGTVESRLRIEQGREGREFPFNGPRDLVANLLWFFELRRPEDASHLKRVESRPEV